MQKLFKDLEGKSECVLSGKKLKIPDVKKLTEFLKKQKNVLLLDLSSDDIGSKGTKVLIEGVKACKSLTTLKLATNGIGDDGIDALLQLFPELPHLSMLDISENPIGEDSVPSIIDFVKKAPSLRSISLGGSNVSPASLSKISSVLADRLGSQKLEVILKDVSLLSLAVDLSDKAMADSDARSLAAYFAANSNLTSLFMFFQGMEDNAGPVFSQNISLDLSSSLEDVYIKFASVTGENAVHVLSGLATGRSLKALRLEFGSTFSDDDFKVVIESLAQFVSLGSLTFGYMASSVNTISEIVNLVKVRALNEINLSFLQVGSSKEHRTMKQIDSHRATVRRALMPMKIEDIDEDEDATLESSGEGGDSDPTSSSTSPSQSKPSSTHSSPTGSRPSSVQVSGVETIIPLRDEVNGVDGAGAGAGAGDSTAPVDTSKMEAVCRVLDKTYVNLRVLRLVGNRLGDADAIVLARNVNGNSLLFELDLSHNSIGDKGLNAICAALKPIPVGDKRDGVVVAFSSTAAPAHTPQHSMKRSTSMRNLGPSTPPASYLKRLNLSFNMISPRGIGELSALLAEQHSAFLKFAPRISTPSMIFNPQQLNKVSSLKPSHKSGDSISIELDPNKPGISSLNLSGNEIGDAGMSCFAEKGAGGLKELFLNHCELSSSGIVLLLQAVAGNLKLEALHLRGNTRVGDEGIESIRSALSETSNVLRALDVSLCGFREKGAQSLLELVRERTIIQSVAFKENIISSGAREKLTSQLQKNSSM